MHFAQGSHWSNRAHIVPVRPSLLITPRCYLQLGGFRNQAEEEKQAFPECHTKHKHGVKQSIRPGALPPKAALLDQNGRSQDPAGLFIITPIISDYSSVQPSNEVRGI